MGNYLTDSYGFQENYQLRGTVIYGKMARN
jgi:hypothetical protein